MAKTRATRKIKEGYNSRPTRAMLTLRSMLIAAQRHNVLEGTEQAEQLLLLAAVELGLLGGQVDAEAAVHALGPAARLDAIVPRLLGGRHDQRVLLQVGRQRRLHVARRGEHVGPLAVLLVDGQDGSLTGKVVELLAAAADQVRHHAVDQQHGGPGEVAGQQQQVPRRAVEPGRVGYRRGHGQHPAVAQGAFQQGGATVEIGEHHAHAGRRRFQFPIAVDGGVFPGDFGGAAAEFDQDGMFQRPRGEVSVAVGTPRLPQQLARQQALRGGDVEGIDGSGIAAQEDRHAMPLGGVIAQFLPQRRFQRRRVQEAHGRIAVQGLLRQLVQPDHLAIEAGPPQFHPGRRRQRRGEEKCPLLGGLRRRDQHCARAA